MSHSAELSRIMAKARISANTMRQDHYRFPRNETDEARRIPWASRPPILPDCIDWWAFWDGVVIVVCAVGVVLALAGVI